MIKLFRTSGMPRLPSASISVRALSPLMGGTDCDVLSHSVASSLASSGMRPNRSDRARKTLSVSEASLLKAIRANCAFCEITRQHRAKVFLNSSIDRTSLEASSPQDPMAQAGSSLAPCRPGQIIREKPAHTLGSVVR